MSRALDLGYPRPSPPAPPRRTLPAGDDLGAITPQEYDIIWAALRYYADGLATGRAHSVEDIATCCGEHPLPTDDQVHELADRFTDHSGLEFYP